MLPKLHEKERARPSQGEEDGGSCSSCGAVAAFVALACGVATIAFLPGIRQWCGAGLSRVPTWVAFASGAGCVAAVVAAAWLPRVAFRMFAALLPIGLVATLVWNVCFFSSVNKKGLVPKLGPTRVAYRLEPPADNTLFGLSRKYPVPQLDSHLGLPIIFLAYLRGRELVLPIGTSKRIVTMLKVISRVKATASSPRGALTPTELARIRRRPTTAVAVGGSRGYTFLTFSLTNASDKVFYMMRGGGKTYIVPSRLLDLGDKGGKRP